MKVLNQIIAKILPFIGIGIFIVLFIFGLVLFSYLLLIGAAIGLILFAVGYVRARLFRKKSPSYTSKKSTGRIIDATEVEEIEEGKTRNTQEDENSTTNKSP